MFSYWSAIGSDSCEAAELKCYHCGEPHAAWNLKCRENLFPSKVAQVIHTQKLQRFDASDLVRLRYPNRASSYATIVRAGLLAATIETTSIVQQPTQTRALPPRTPANHQTTHTENEMEHETRSSKRGLEVENEESSNRSVVPNKASASGSSRAKKND